MTHSRPLYPAAAVEAPPAEAEGTPDPGFAGFGVANESLGASGVPNESFATSGPQARTSGPGSVARQRREASRRRRPVRTGPPPSLGGVPLSSVSPRPDKKRANRAEPRSCPHP